MCPTTKMWMIELWCWSLYIGQ